MQALILRDATGDEPAEVPAIVEGAYTEYRQHFPPAVWRSYRQELSAVAERSATGAVIVAVRDGELVGAVTFYRDAAADGHPWPPGGASLRLLAVLVTARGTGVGRALVTECIARARRIDASFLGLHTAPFMAAANRLYAAVGFQRAPQHDFDAEEHYGGALPTGRLVGEAFLLPLQTPDR